MACKFQVVVIHWENTSSVYPKYFTDFFKINVFSFTLANTQKHNAFDQIGNFFSVPNLVSLTCLSLKILGKTEVGVFQISRFLIKVYCHNSRNSDHIDMKLGPVTKLNKRNKTISKK